MHLVLVLFGSVLVISSLLCMCLLSDSLVPHVPAVISSNIRASMHSSLLSCLDWKIYRSGFHVFTMVGNVSVTFSLFRLPCLSSRSRWKLYVNSTGETMHLKLSCLSRLYFCFHAPERWHMLPDVGRLCGKLALLLFQDWRIPFQLNHDPLSCSSGKEQPRRGFLSLTLYFCELDVVFPFPFVSCHTLTSVFIIFLFYFKTITTCNLFTKFLPATCLVWAWPAKNVHTKTIMYCIFSYNSYMWRTLIHVARPRTSSIILFLVYLFCYYDWKINIRIVLII